MKRGQEHKMISFIVNTYNRQLILMENIYNMKPLGKRVEIVVVDDMSTDGTRNKMKDFMKSNPDMRIKYVRNESNQGYAKSMNTGINSSSNDYVFILNDDVFLKDPISFLRFLEKDFEKENIIMTRLDMEEPFTFIQRAKSFFYSIPAQMLAGEIYNYNNEKRRYVRYGNNIFGFNKKVLRILFDDRSYSGNFFRIESDFEARARSLGFKIVYDPRLLVLHRWHPTGGLRQENKRKFLYWCIYNHLIFLRKNSGWTKYHKTMFYFLLKSVSHPVRIKTILSAFSKAFKAKIKY